MISNCSPKVLGQISQLNADDIKSFRADRLEFVGNCLMEFVNLIIYERMELDEGWENLKKYCSHKYDAYQHFLILKSCADLLKFEVSQIEMLE